MTLKDRFNPNDGSLIDKIDSFFLDFNEKIAEKWQNKTYVSKEKLEDALYLSSSLFLSLYIVDSHINDKFGYFMAGPAIYSALKYSFNSLRPKNSLDEQVTLELINLPTKTMKYSHLFLYGISTIALSLGIGKILTGLVASDSHLYAESINDLTLGLGVFTWTSADYMAKSKIDPPKTKKKSILEKFYGLFPKPALRPAPAKYY